MGVVALFQYPVDEICALLPDLEDAWHEETWRQSLHFTPHRDSESIFIRRQPGSRPRDVLYQLASVCTRHHSGPLALAIDAICAAVGGRPARAMLVRLRPAGLVTSHTDIGLYAESTERFHLPVVTNPGSWVMVDGERYHLEAGIAYAFDKHVEHSAGNDGDEPRIHYIIDVIPEAGGLMAG